MTDNSPYQTYEFLIQRKDGKFYRGTVYGDERDWTTEMRDGFDGAFHYTENGANKKIADFPLAFKGCKVVKTSTVKIAPPLTIVIF